MTKYYIIFTICNLRKYNTIIVSAEQIDIESSLMMPLVDGIDGFDIRLGIVLRLRRKTLSR